MKKVSKDQAKIKRQLHKTYQKIDAEREPVCQGCGRSNKPLSHSHTISQKRCKEIGKKELIWDEDNIELECFGTNKSCHEIWEHGSIIQRMKLLNFDRKMEYLAKNDLQKHVILKLAVKSVTVGLH